MWKHFRMHDRSTCFAWSLTFFNLCKFRKPKRVRGLSHSEHLSRGRGWCGRVGINSNGKYSHPYKDSEGLPTSTVMGTSMGTQCFRALRYSLSLRASVGRPQCDVSTRRVPSSNSHAGGLSYKALPSPRKKKKKQNSKTGFSLFQNITMLSLRNHCVGQQALVLREMS